MALSYCGNQWYEIAISDRGCKGDFSVLEENFVQAISPDSEKVVLYVGQYGTSEN